MIKFSDFLGSKGKEFAADYDGVLAVRPPENGKYPNTPPPAGKRTPYRGSEEEDPGLQMADKDSVDGLADVAVKNMPADKMIPGGKKPQKKVSAVPPPKKLKESQILSEEDRKVIAEGASFVHDLHGEPFTPHPFETMTYISSLLHNPKMVSRLIREVKRQGKLGELVKELLDHPEFYQEVVSNMGHDENGEHVAGKLSRAMHDHAADIKEKYGLSEAVAPELVDDMEDLSPDEDGHMPTDNQTQQQQPEGDGFTPGDDSMPSQEEEEVRPKKKKANMPHHKMIKGMVPFFKDDMVKACQDGDC